MTLLVRFRLFFRHSVSSRRSNPIWKIPLPTPPGSMVRSLMRRKQLCWSLCKAILPPPASRTRNLSQLPMWPMLLASCQLQQQVSVCQPAMSPICLIGKIRLLGNQRTQKSHRFFVASKSSTNWWKPQPHSETNPSSNPLIKQETRGFIHDFQPIVICSYKRWSSGAEPLGSEAVPSELWPKWVGKHLFSSMVK